VALIDTGVDSSHPAIKDNVVDFGWDFILDARGGADLSNGIDDDKDGYIDEAHGHGTHLASIIALMNPDVRILPLRVLDADGNGDSFDVADAITYAVDHGAQVINLSLSMKQPSTAVATAMEYAAFAGVSIFASAGNSGKEKIYFPGNYDPRTMSFDWPLAPPGWNASSETVTTIAAMGTCEIKASFSGYGKPVDLVAPGENIYGAMPGGGYAWWSGTSMSTAVASGVASLLFSVGGESLDVPPQDLLETTAEPLDWKNWPFKGKLGKGSIDAMKASYEAAVNP
jgi:subtilisin family serine protease